MAENSKNTMNLEVLMNSLTKKVILVESDNDFIDVLFSFLTMPMATIIRLSHRSKPLPIGCIDNLYGSVESFDSHLFRTEECRSMLLNPRNGKERFLNNLKLKFDDCEPPKYFKCSNFYCRQSFSYYETVHCRQCRRLMDMEVELPVAGGGEGGGAFLKGPARFIISDDFQVMPPFTATSSNLVAKVGFTGWNSIEERTIKVDADEVLNLLMRSLVSKEPMTETLLKDAHVSKLSNENPNEEEEDICIDSRIVGYMANIKEEKEEEEEEKMSIKLVISKSKNMVCYAEAGEHFVNFLFSFLTLPLGFILKQMRTNSFDGCIDHLYNSVKDLDEHYLKSSKHKSALVSPKLPPGFGYKNNPLGIQEALYREIHSSTPVKSVLFVDPKSPHNGDDEVHGFLKGPAMFMVTDRLNVSPISAILGLSMLCQLNVGVTDIEIKVVHVGKKEAFGLLVASFVSNSALTSVFLKKPNEGFGCFSFL